MSRISIYGKNTPHIRAGLEKAQRLNLDGVLSQVHFPSSKCAIGYVFGRPGFQDETPIRTSTIVSVADSVITTESGSRYFLADFRDTMANQDMEMLCEELNRHKIALDECVGAQGENAAHVA
jgi:hypothetical protein